MIGFFAPWLVHGLVLVLHRALPAREIDGYVLDPTGRPLRYRLNGLPVMAIVVTGFFLFCRVAGVPWDWLFVHRWEGLAGACGLGLLFTLAIVLPAPPVRGLVADLFFGRLENPRAFGVDAKMYLYLTGATLLALNLVSFAAHAWMSHGASPGVGIHLVLFLFFVSEYLVFEQVHLYTYDLFAERVGFKLGWGCLVFYPYFYAVGLWTTADVPSRTPIPILVAAVAVFFAGWTLARGANLQKFHFKLDPDGTFLGRRHLYVTDGQRRLLASGFWGVSRHVNYLGEILMASGLALCLGPHVGPWLYPLYYVLLLVPRERDDERRCAAKYGELWAQYTAKVRWRIVPGVY